MQHFARAGWLHAVWCVDVRQRSTLCCHYLSGLNDGWRTLPPEPCHALAARQNINGLREHRTVPRSNLA